MTMEPASIPPPAAGARLFGATGQEWVVLRTTHAEEDPEIWLVHVIKAADALAGQRHLSLVMTGEEFCEFCRAEGIT
ncbi:hypothetical protein ACFPOE_16565 [Caenimonas terrae]|uniref:Uncharacterized protein n=1 Tax=Caenimonas terrae TaxID=696074 RepID=A0ABW0NIL1_9BURK